MSDVDFAYDLAFITNTLEVLSAALTVMREEASEGGFNISCNKSKTMYISSIPSSDGSVESEYNLRIAKATSVLGRLNNIWCNPLLSRLTKMWVFSAYVGSEAWPATTMILKKLDAFQSKGLQKIEGFAGTNFSRTPTSCPVRCRFFSPCRLRNVH